MSNNADHNNSLDITTNNTQQVDSNMLVSISTDTTNTTIVSQEQTSSLSSDSQHKIIPNIAGGQSYLLAQVDTTQLSNEARQTHFLQVSALAEVFDYNSFKNYHIDGNKYLNGIENTNYAQATQLDSQLPAVQHAKAYMSQRFRGFYPVVIDLETTGVDYFKHSIIQIAAVALTVDADNNLVPYAELKINVHPVEGKSADPHSLAITGINPFNPRRKACSLKDALNALAKFTRGAQKAHGCKRSVLVAHNVAFDAGFIYHNLELAKIKRSPFHPFTSFDTSVLAAAFIGETRMGMALEKIGKVFDSEQAHDALYDTQQCAELFCYCINQLKDKFVAELSTEQSLSDTADNSSFPNTTTIN